jgi:hypothetical protein
LSGFARSGRFGCGESTVDEPDGSGDPLNAMSDAYEAIRELDPYRPVSLVLNCDEHGYGVLAMINIFLSVC